MTATVSDITGRDLLTRTTLQIDADASPSAMLRTVAALQRVPGVLLADVDAADNRAIVAHDAAVNVTSLLAAIAASGARATVVDGTPAPSTRASGGLRAQHARIRRLMTVAVAIFVPLALIDALLPNTANKAWLLPIFISALWLFFFAEVFVGRRP